MTRPRIGQKCREYPVECGIERIWNSKTELGAKEGYFIKIVSTLESHFLHYHHDEIYIS
jgi:hypothetical protein